MVLFGRPLARAIYRQLKLEIQKLKQKPVLAVILVGCQPASLKYVQIKKKRARILGIAFKLFHLTQNTPQKNIEDLINKLNNNPKIDGIVLQLPLPANFDTEKIVALISKEKDVDGLKGGYPAPTATAILAILKFYDVNLADKKIVLVGHGQLVGKPLEQILRRQNLNPIVCDSRTKNLKEKTIQADILISATGAPGLIKPDWIKTGATIIDAGTTESDGKLVGDIDQAVYTQNISYTPIPGGVGPVTVAMLMKNVAAATKKQNRKNNG